MFQFLRGPGLTLLLGLTACAGMGGQQSVNGGAAPDVKATLLANKSRLWKDPESVRDASISQPFRDMFGWRVCMRANAKNSYGGYTGLQTSTVLIYDNGSPPLPQETTIYDGCGGRAYEPFPEIEGGYRPPIPTTQPEPKSRTSR